MKNKSKLLIITAITTLIITIASIIAFILFPPAGAVIGIVGAGVVTGLILEALKPAFNVLIEHTVDQTPIEPIHAIYTEYPTHTLTFKRHVDEQDTITGKHIITDSEETITETEHRGPTL